MYLSKLYVRNFRCYDDKGIEITFQPSVNIIIGENNTGKTAIIDALRISLAYGAGRRDIYITNQDFHIHNDGKVAEDIAFDLFFSDLSDEEQATFYELIVLDNPITAQVHIRYKRDKANGLEKVKTSIWGGEKEGQNISFQTMELISYIFLGALRDAENDLKPGRGNRLGQLLRKLVVDDNEKRKICHHVQVANHKILNEKKVRQASDIINGNLFGIERERLQQSIRLGLVSPEFNHISDSFRALLNVSDREEYITLSKEDWEDLDKQYPNIKVIEGKLAETDVGYGLNLGNLTEAERNQIGEDTYNVLLAYASSPFELHQNGLGYNNLIYISTVLGDLQERKNIETYSYNALLIEEPEAHLHPQLQDLLFEFFKSNSKNTKGKVENPVQLFLTSHSPTLTSQADIDNIIVFHRQINGKVIATSLRNCELEKVEKSDLKRYLDVTKSQLFFAKGVLIVEGISEALLIPVLAKREGYTLDHNAVEIVNISGVAFSPFAKLFNSVNPSNRLNIPCAILSDDDRCTDGIFKLNDIDFTLKGFDPDIVLDKFEKGEPSPRAKKALALKGGNLDVQLAYKTFEYELAKIPENLDIMLDILDKIHPTKIKWIRETFSKKALSDEQKAIYLWLAVRDAKAEFSQRLAAVLDEFDDQGSPKINFKVPQYIIDVLKHIAIPIKSLQKPQLRQVK